MLFKRNEMRSLRSEVGYNGMMLYTLDQEQVCIAYNVNGENYTLRNEPAIYWKIKEDNFHCNYSDNYSKKELTFLIIRVILEIGIPTIILNICSYLNLLTPHTRGSLFFFLLSLGYILECSIFKGLKRRKSIQGKFLLSWRGALNMALNALEKKNYPPTLEEIKKCSIYRINKDYHLSPNEISSIFFLFLSIALLMPTGLSLIISIPILIFLFCLAYKTALFGLLRLTFVVTPDLCELKMAKDLIDFWYSVSYKKTPVK